MKNDFLVAVLIETSLETVVKPKIFWKKSDTKEHGDLMQNLKNYKFILKSEQMPK